MLVDVRVHGELHQLRRDPALKLGPTPPVAADPALREAVETERQGNARRVADALADRAPAAVDRLSRIVTEGTDRDAAAAAAVLLREARQHREAAYIADRLRAVEDALHTRRDTA